MARVCLTFEEAFPIVRCLEIGCRGLADFLVEREGLSQLFRQLHWDLSGGFSFVRASGL